MSKNKLPPIPKARYKDNSQQQQADALQNMTEILAGRKGNGLDRAILVRDLVDMGLARLRGGGGVALGDVGSLIDSGDSGGGITVVTPPAPSGVLVSGAFESILITWDKPAYTVASPSSHTEIWRHSTNVLSSATLVGTTTADLYGDIVGTDSSYYYWIRHVNVGYDNQVRYGPYSDANGILGQTSPDIGVVIDDIAEQMRDSDLVNELNGKIDDVDVNGSQAHQALWTKQVSAGDITAGIGLLAGANGTSEFVVAASNFYVFDPNNPDGTITPTFAIDNGNVIIPSALIETATIQILNSQIITADYVNAGIEINSPTINSAIINTANIRGAGDAGFGQGGPYSGYNTFIHSSGLIQTNNLQAYGGEFDNVLIKENCTIRGTLDGADGTFSGTVNIENLEGDIYSSKNVFAAYYKSTSNHSWRTGASATVKTDTSDRIIMIMGVDFWVYSAGSEFSGYTARAKVVQNGVTYYSAEISDSFTAPSHSWSDNITITSGGKNSFPGAFVIALPAHTNTTDTATVTLEYSVNKNHSSCYVSFGGQDLVFTSQRTGGMWL